MPDPASRANPYDVHGSSQVVDPSAFDWQDDTWKGRLWYESVIYELHVGTFTAEGTFTAALQRLDYLVELGITAIELMPIADFPGKRNWGYDGVLLFAPDSCYGTPEELKALVQAAHTRGLMVLLDVVYNHFGPDGNYLHAYAPQFFSEHHHSPWGAAINFDGKGSRMVRDFFIHNALYWLEEYHLDGLRLDAVHAIVDDSRPNIVEEIAAAVQASPGCVRQVHLILENDANVARYLQQGTIAAQWNDDIHHALHVLLTGESAGYYQDFMQQPLQHLGRCLTEGFAYQGEVSAYRGGKTRGEPCSDVPLTAFVSFLQNHDQVGNRALGERISNLCDPDALRAATAILLLAPSPPLLFMGQEWASSQPFTYFVDFPEELGNKVNQGRLQEFTQFPAFNDAELRRKIPLPNAANTYQLAKLDWDEINHAPHQQWFEYHQELLHIRSSHITPRLKAMVGGQAHYRLLNERTLSVEWRLNDGSALRLLANLDSEPAKVDCSRSGEVLFASDAEVKKNQLQGSLSPWSVIFCLDEEPKND